MKYAEKIFPKGSFPDQRTDGGYIDGTLAKNLDIYAKKIVNDMHFLILITGNDSVGNGKSTLASHVGCYLTNKINELHGLNNTYTSENVNFKSIELVQNSHKHPKYSVQTLDEGDDLTQHSMKETMQNLKRYFRKCRQLNQIVILILPSFFELPKFFALSRSHCLLNVKFEGEFERGFFDFYGPTAKKLLYLKGKKEWDYSAHPKDFDGVFSQSYAFFPNLDDEIKKYKKHKRTDMEDDAQLKEELMTRHEIERLHTIKLFRQAVRRSKIKIMDLSQAFSITRRTATTWLSDDYTHLDGISREEMGNGRGNINYPVQGDDESGEEEFQ